MLSSFDRRHFPQGSAALGDTLLTGAVPLHRAAAAMPIRIVLPMHCSGPELHLAKQEIPEKPVLCTTGSRFTFTT